MSLSRALTKAGEQSGTKVMTQLGRSGELVPTKAYGGKLTGMEAAALGIGAAVANSNSGNNNASGAPESVLSDNMDAAGSVSNFKASMQHLEAPLNAAITGWLNNFSPNVGALLKMTGYEPLQLVDAMVKRLHRWGVNPTSANVNAAMLDIMDSAEERADIRNPDQLIETNLDEQEVVLTPNSAVYRRTATAIAELRAAAACLPGGIGDLIRIRAALEMRKDVFVAAVQMGWGFHPESILGDEVQDASERLYIRP